MEDRVRNQPRIASACGHEFTNDLDLVVPAWYGQSLSLAHNAPGVKGPFKLNGPVIRNYLRLWYRLHKPGKEGLQRQLNLPDLGPRPHVQMVR